MNARLLRVPLIPPAAVDADGNLVVKMVIGINIEIGQGESDPSYVISDGQFFIGAIIRDKSNYKNGAPCLGIEGSSGKAMGGDRRQDYELPNPSESYYPGRLETRLSLSDRWGGDPKTLTPGPWTSPTDRVHGPPHGPVQGPPIRTTLTDPLKKSNRKKRE